MFIDKKHKIRKVAEENVILKQGKAGAELTKIIALNESAKLLFEHFRGQTFDEKMVANALVELYGIDAATAETDALRWIESLKEQGIITD